MSVNTTEFGTLPLSGIALNASLVNATNGLSFNHSTPIPAISAFYVSSGPMFDEISNLVFTKTLLPSLIYVCILLTIGIPGNILVIYVYMYKWNHSTSRIFILALGSYDLINCLCSMTTEIALLLKFLEFDVAVWCKVSRFITASINSGSTFILVCIAVDRFKRICRIHGNHIDPNLARNLVIASIVFASATSWPTLILYGTYTVYIPLKPMVYLKGKTCLIEDRMNETIYPLIFVIFLLSSHFLVDLTFIVLYSFVGKVVCNQHKIRKSMKLSTKPPSVERSENVAEISQTSFTLESCDHLQNKANNVESKKENGSKTSNRPVSFLLWKKLSTNSIKTKVDKKNSKMLAELKQSLKSRSSKESNTKSRKIHAGKTTLMLFLVTIMFILSFLPYSILVILRYTDLNFYARLSSESKSVYNLFLRSYLLNSVVNPIVYCFISKQFRQKSKEAIGSLICFKNKD